MIPQMKAKASLWTSMPHAPSNQGHSFMHRALRKKIFQGDILS